MIYKPYTICICMPSRLSQQYLTTNHENTQLSFLSPPAGPGIYLDVFVELSRKGLRRPSLGELSALIAVAWENKQGRFFRKLENIMYGPEQLLWAFTRTLSTSRGIYCYDDREGSVINEKSLVKQLRTGATQYCGVSFSKDKGVRFVAKKQLPPTTAYKHRAVDLPYEPILLALAGVEGARNVAGVASALSCSTGIFFCESALDEGLTAVDIGGGGLRFYTYSPDDDHDGGYSYGYTQVP